MIRLALRVGWTLAALLWLAWPWIAESTEAPGQRSTRAPLDAPRSPAESEERAGQSSNFAEMIDLARSETYISEATGLERTVGFVYDSRAGILRVAARRLEICCGVLTEDQGGVRIEEAAVNVRGHDAGSSVALSRSVRDLLASKGVKLKRASQMQYGNSLTAMCATIVETLGRASTGDGQRLVRLLRRFPHWDLVGNAADADVLANIVGLNVDTDWRGCLSGPKAAMRIDVLARHGHATSPLVRFLVSQSDGECLARFAEAYAGEIRAAAMREIVSHLSRLPKGGQRSALALALSARLASAEEWGEMGGEVAQLLAEGSLPVSSRSLRLLWKTSPEQTRAFLRSAATQERIPFSVVTAVVGAPELATDAAVQGIADWGSEWRKCLKNTIARPDR